MNAAAKTEKLMNQLIKTPHLVIEKLDLVYINNQRLPIERCKCDDGFVYKKTEDALSEKAN